MIILVAFQFDSGGDDDNGGGEFGSLIDFATCGGLNFALFALFVSASFLLVVVVALFCGDTVASEASWGSLRYLLAVPVPRARLLAVKLIVALGYSGLALLPARRHRAARRHAAVRLGSAAQHGRRRDPGRARGCCGCWASSATWRSCSSSWPGWRSCCRCSTDAPLGAVGGAVLLWILSSILDQITALGVAAQPAADPLQHGVARACCPHRSQFDDIVKGAISAVVYATLFWSLAFWRFIRKDVVSS